MSPLKKTFLFSRLEGRDKGDNTGNVSLRFWRCPIFRLSLLIKIFAWDFLYIISIDQCWNTNKGETSSVLQQTQTERTEHRDHVALCSTKFATPCNNAGNQNKWKSNGSRWLLSSVQSYRQSIELYTVSHKKNSKRPFGYINAIIALEITYTCVYLLQIELKTIGQLETKDLVTTLSHVIQET